jgi:hypothetical protein
MKAILRSVLLALAIIPAPAVPADAGPFALGPVQLHCEFSTAANSCHRLGARSHTQAHYKVYDLFRNRESLREKDPEAVERILMAAEQGDIDAQYDLGISEAAVRHFPASNAVR